MAKLRNTLARTIEKAKKLLAEWNNPIAYTTLELINSKEIDVRSYKELHSKDIVELADEHDIAIDMHSRAPLQFSEKVADGFYGFYYDNRVYITDKTLSPSEVAKTLIHEINHYLNISNKNYKTKTQIFNEEYRALVAEHSGQNRPITRSFYSHCAQKVCDDYNVPLPKRHKPSPKPPKGIFQR